MEKKGTDPSIGVGNLQTMKRDECAISACRTSEDKKDSKLLQAVSASESQTVLKDKKSEYDTQTPLKLPAEIEEALKQLQTYTPCYCYFEDKLLENMRALLKYKAPFGLTVRYAMKANSTKAILQLMKMIGVAIDAATVNECYRAIAAGITPGMIQLTSQEVPSQEILMDLVLNKGIRYVAGSLRQLENYGVACRGKEVGIRFNIGIGSGGCKRTTTGGKEASFGIYGQKPEIDRLLLAYGLTLTTVHLHIGSGSDPALQKEAAIKGLDIVAAYPTVTTLNLGGGFKVARMPNEKQTDIDELSETTAQALLQFAKQTQRLIKLEIEPGTASVALSGYVVGTVIDIVTTGEDGYNFIKTDTGMTEVLRVALYGAQHPLYVVPMDSTTRCVKSYIVSGSCCESGDILTTAPHNPEELHPRTLIEAKVGDLLVIGAAGAYCSSMSTANYNSHLKSAEYIVRHDGHIRLIRKRQTLEDLWQLELDLNSES